MAVVEQCFKLVADVNREYTNLHIVSLKCYEFARILFTVTDGVSNRAFIETMKGKIAAKKKRTSNFQKPLKNIYRYKKYLLIVKYESIFNA